MIHLTTLSITQAFAIQVTARGLHLLTNMTMGSGATAFGGLIRMNTNMEAGKVLWVDLGAQVIRRRRLTRMTIMIIMRLVKDTRRSILGATSVSQTSNHPK